MVAGDGIKPRRELGALAKRIYTLKRLDKNFLRQIDRGIHVSGHVLAPGSNFPGVTLEQDVQERFSACRSFGGLAAFD